MKYFFTILIILLSISNNLTSQEEAFKSFGNAKGIVFDLCFSKHGSMIAVAENNSAIIYNTQSQEVLYQLKGGHTKQMLCLDMSPDSSFVITGGKDSLIVLWDIKNQEVIAKLNYHKGVITDIKFHPEKKWFTSGSSDNTVIIYNYDSKSIVHKLTLHEGDISSIAINSYGNMLASASEDKTIAIWDIESGELLNRLTAHKSFIRDIAFSTDNTRLISCDDKSKVIIWKTNNIEDVRILKEEKQGNAWMLNAVFFNENKTYATAGFDGKIRVSTSFGDNKYKIGKIIHKIAFMPNNNSKIIFGVGTHGKGALILDTSKY